MSLATISHSHTTTSRCQSGCDACKPHSDWYDCNKSILTCSFAVYMYGMVHWNASNTSLLAFSTHLNVIIYIFFSQSKQINESYKTILGRACQIYLWVRWILTVLVYLRAKDHTIGVVVDYLMGFYAFRYIYGIRMRLISR